MRVQTDGVGLRTGTKAEFTLVAPVMPGGAEIFRQRAVKAQIEAGYWEGKLGTVHDLRVCLIQIDDAKASLRRALPRVTSAACWDTPVPFTLNIVVTWHGLRALDVPPGRTGQFPGGVSDRNGRAQGDLGRHRRQ